MRIDIATLFPEMCETVLSTSILGRAARAGLLDFACWQIRDYTMDKHKNVDDTPYGPGKGMLMQADPIYRAWEHVCALADLPRPHVVYLSPQGRTLTQRRAKELALMPRLLLICGHYEGVDQRVIDEVVDEEISIGDYVLTGGELGALVLADCVCRLCPGVLADESCYTEESHWDGLLEYPHYTKPPVWHGREVPEVLQTGNHAAIARWRREMQLRVTLQKRPEMLANASLCEKDKWFLRALGWQEPPGSGET